MECSQIFSSKVQVTLFSSSFIWCFFDLVNKFSFLKNGQKVLDVINVCCHCCLKLFFDLASFLYNG